MKRHFSWTASVLALGALGCSGSSPKGVQCASTTCVTGQVCCIDCRGQGTCGAPGLVCSGQGCSPDGGSLDAGTFGCGNTTCAAGQVCCIDCNGQGTCGPPGTTCSGGGCSCGSTAQTCCTTQPTCGNGLTCCVGVPYPQGGECLSSCSAASDRNIKRGFAPVDAQQILDRVSELPLSSWSYQSEPADVRHLGPMAQDFHAAFGLGDSDRRIDFVDANGVTLAALQALRQRVDQLSAENAQLKERISALERGRRERR